MIAGLTIALILALGIDLLLVILCIYNFKKYYPTEDGATPKVSILIAAKDEEANIERCLDSLILLSYPLEKLEILVGNDASEDDTLSISKPYAEKYQHIKIFDITSQVGEQKGKANVLAQLAQQATGEHFLITDTDMVLPTHWVESMLSAIKDKAGLAIGVTHVSGSRMQDLDWIFGLGMIKVVTDLGMPVTGMGNNMIITKEAYLSVGGYESLPFSITEDYELFKHVKNKGYQSAHIFQKEVLGTTLPMTGLANLLNQRKRWMRGAIQLPWYVTGLLLLQPLFYFGLFALLFFTPDAAVLLLVGKLVLRLGFMTTLRRKLHLPFRGLSLILYEFYAVIIAIISIFYFLLPFKVEWKGRDY